MNKDAFEALQPTKDPLPATTNRPEAERFSASIRAGKPMEFIREGNPFEKSPGGALTKFNHWIASAPTSTGCPKDRFDRMVAAEKRMCDCQIEIARFSPPAAKAEYRRQIQTERDAVHADLSSDHRAESEAEVVTRFRHRKEVVHQVLRKISEEITPDLKAEKLRHAENARVLLATVLEEEQADAETTGIAWEPSPKVRGLQWVIGTCTKEAEAAGTIYALPSVYLAGILEFGDAVPARGWMSKFIATLFPERTKALDEHGASMAAIEAQNKARRLQPAPTKAITPPKVQQVQPMKPIVSEGEKQALEFITPKVPTKAPAPAPVEPPAPEPTPDPAWS